MKKNLLFTLMAVFLAGFGFGGISMAEESPSCTENSVAKIGDTCYDSLESAIAGANNGDVVYLLKDYTISEAIQINDKSLTIEGSGDSKKTIGFSSVADIWNSNTAYVFKIGINSASSDINVKLKNLIIQNSFYGIKHGYSTSSKKTILTLHDVSFKNLTYGAVDMQNELSELHNEGSVEIEDGDLFVNIDTYDGNKNYVIPEGYDYCYINLNKYTCFNNENSLLGMEADVIAKIGTKYFSNLANAIEAADDTDDTDTVKIIKEYNDILPDVINKSINIESEDGVSVTFKSKCSYSNFSSCVSKPITSIAENKVVTFSGVTFDLAGDDSNFDNAHHNGIQGNGKIIMNNCIVKGTLTTYGDSEFNSCNFTKTSGGYNIFGIQGQNTIFKDCSFNGKDRNVNVYNSNVSTSQQSVVFDNCKFNASSSPVKGAIVVHETADGTNTNKFKVEITNFESSNLGAGYAGIKNVHAIWQKDGENAFVKYLTGNGLIMFDDGRRDIPHEGGEITISINGGDPVYSTPKIESESIPSENKDKGLTITKNYYLSLGKILSETGVDSSKDGDLNKFYITNPIYSITLGNVTNGTISSNLLSAEEGTTVTLTATPNSNYNFSKWTVKSGNVEIKVENNQFTMPAANVTVSATFTAKPTSSGGGSSGGSSSSSSSKTTTTTDTKKAEETKTENKTSEEIELKGEVTEEQTSEKVEETATPDNNYSKEFNDAYSFAHKNGITTMDSIEKADMNAPLTRIAMAKMLSQYAINVLGKTPDTTKVVPNFSDVPAELDAEYNNGVTLAYQLGIMGIGIEKFRPFDLVTRAEFGTALSRMLYGLADGEGAYYETHLAKLMEEKIITVDTPDLQELRGYVMIMLMRSANK